MLTLRSVTTVLGLALVAAVATTSSALTPEEEAALREEARQLTEQARAQEAQADAARETAQQIFISEFKKADGLDDQADSKKVAALQRWLLVGESEAAKAVGLRESARSILLRAYRLGVLASLVDEEATNERFRAQLHRAAAATLLANNPDAEAVAVADKLDRLADKHDRDAEGYENEAEDLRERADSATRRADALIERAVELETAP